MQGGMDQNTGHLVEFKPVDISDGGWNVGPGTKVSDNGTTCDIHISNLPDTILELNAPSKRIGMGSTLTLTAILKNEKVASFVLLPITIE